MAKDKYYCIFETSLGFAGLAGTEDSIQRSCICKRNYSAAEAYLLVGMEEFLYEPDFKLPVQERFKGYFIGAISDFSDIKVSFEGLREFPERVLKALRKVSAGRAVSYGQLAELAGCPKGGRAVGTILKKNPVPLIIPCHRVIKADGSLGNFMGNEPRGSYFKEKMLQLEGF